MPKNYAPLNPGDDLPYRCPVCRAQPLGEGKYGCGGVFVQVSGKMVGSCPQNADAE